MSRIKVVSNFFSRIKRYRFSASVRDFKKHTSRAFPQDRSALSKKSIVLIEANHMQSAHIVYSYILNVLADEHEARIVAFSQRKNALWTCFFNKIKQLLHVDFFGIYLAFGTSEFIEISLNKKQKQRAELIYNQIKPTIKSKEDVVNISICEIEIGALIYDNYLRLYHVPTIDINDKEFSAFLMESIETFVFWDDYFDSHDVKSINISHSVYNLAIPMRLAVARNIPAYQANIKSIYRLSSENKYALTDFKNYRKIFASLPETEQQKGKIEAQLQIEKRLAGQVGVDMEYSTKSAYGEIKPGTALKKSSNIKVLIATHCFFDSPHPYGENLFPDFYEWLNFLGKMSEKTDYDWYLKTHPDYLDGTMEVIDEILKNYPKIVLLPADTSHHQIISEGINCALSVYGTIGFEYAALGITVINASKNNPHIAYDFNLHPSSINEYTELLLNLDKLELIIDKDQVNEYYFMHHIYYSENIFFSDYKNLINELGGYEKLFTNEIYEEWLKQFTIENHELIIENIKKFINTSEYRMKL